MSKAQVIVGGVSDLSAAGAAPPSQGRRAKGPSAAAALLGRPQQMTVWFDGGRNGLLDTSEERGRVWADVLLSLRDSGQPAYVELDSRSRAITRLLLPVEDVVKEIREAPDADGVEVDFRISHAIHTVRRSNPDYDPILAALRRAEKNGSMLLVTRALDEPEIIDVRPSGRRKPSGRAGRPKSR